jgi:hypothetical protein
MRMMTTRINGSYGNAVLNLKSAQYISPWREFSRGCQFFNLSYFQTQLTRLHRYHDDRVMEFMLMRLFFPHELDDYDEINQAQLYVQSPILSHLDHYASAIEPQPRQREEDSPIQLTPRVPSPTQDPPPSIPISVTTHLPNAITTRLVTSSLRQLWPIQRYIQRPMFPNGD